MFFFQNSKIFNFKAVSQVFTNLCLFFRVFFRVFFLPNLPSFSFFRIFFLPNSLLVLLLLLERRAWSSLLRIWGSFLYGLFSASGFEPACLYIRCVGELILAVWLIAENRVIFLGRPLGSLRSYCSSSLKIFVQGCSRVFKGWVNLQTLTRFYWI